MTIKTERLLARAKKIAKKGEVEEAKKIFSMVLESSPHNQEAKNGLLALHQSKDQLGPPQEQIKSIIALFSGGQVQEALDSVGTLINDYPHEPLLFNIRAACYQAIGKLDDAVKNFEKALAIKPDYAEAQYNLGITLRELGQIDDAIKSYEKALAIKHGYPDAHNNLGNIFLERNQLDAAANHFEWAVAFKPDFAEAYNNLGIVHRERNQPYEAIENFEKAVAIKDDYEQGQLNLGHTLQEVRKLDEAIKRYEKVLAINPNYAQAHLNLGLVHQECGQVDEAVKKFEKTLATNPNYAEAYYNLSSINQYTISDAQITQMQSLLSTSNLSQSDRIHLSFSLARVNENLGNQDEFFKFLHEGNRLRKEELNYSLDQDQNLFSVVKKMFSSAPSLSYEPSTIRPVFIVGMPRSGTTLVEQIIASHHAVYGAGELDTLSILITPIARDYLVKDKSKFTEEDFISIREQYLDALSRFNAPENVITDKLPLNFLHIGFILSAFPEAKIVHLKRDARATCWSIYKSNFRSRGNGFSYNLDDLTGFYGLYTDLMDFWHQLFPGKIYNICYEDLTTNQEEETRKLLEYCELDWDENCLNFHTSKRAVKTASTLQVRQKMYQGSSEAWKKYEAHLEPLIKALDSY